MLSRDEFARRFPSVSSPLSGAEIDTLLRVLERRAVAQGEVLLTEDSPSPCAYLVEEGSFQVMIGPAGAGVEAGRLEVGSWIGEVSLLDQGPATATVTAATPAVVLALPPATLEQLRQTDPGLATNLVRAMCVTIAGRVRRATNQLEALRSGTAAPPALPRRGLLEALRALLGAGS